LSVGRLYFAFSILILLSACGREETPLVFGLSGPLTDPVGQSIQHGAELALLEINRQGGIGGRRLVLRSMDDHGDADSAVIVARRLRDDNSVLAVIGPAGNYTASAAAQVYGASSNPIVAVTPTATSIDFGSLGEHMFRVCPDAIVHAEGLANWATSRLGVGNAVTLYWNDEEGRSAADAFRNTLEAGGGAIVADDPFSSELPSFEPYLARATRRNRVDAVAIFGNVSRIGAIAAALNTLSLRPTILGSTDLARFIPEADGMLEGAHLSSAYLTGRVSARNAPFREAFRQEHGGAQPDAAAAGAYDIVYILAQAVSAVGTDRVRIRSYLAGMGTDTEPFEGVSGTIGFDENGNLSNPTVDIGVVRNGEVVPADGRSP